MVFKALVLLGLFVCISTTAGSRLNEHATVGRKLLDITLGTYTTPFSLTAFSTSSGTPNGNCYVQGYPGSRADSAVAGPLTVSVPANGSLTISFTRGSDSYFQNYNYSGSINQTSVSQNSSYGLISTTFAPTASGQVANVFSGLVTGSNPITSPTCVVNITFFAIPPPSPPSPAPATPTAPSLGGACSGVIPCYCQNGYCFNNGATLSNTCAPPSGQSCTPASVAPSSIGIQYAYGYSSPVNVCKCTATGASG